jgi:anti-sigma factor RsiW
MNPEKLFAYLDGTLPDAERAELETRLASDAQLQREFGIAKEIHARSHGASREVIFQDETSVADRGRKMALRVGTAFIVLIALNVAIGLIFIARKEAANPNRKLLETQMREQLSKSLEQAAHAALPPPPLGISDISVSAARGQLNRVADQVVATAKRLGGSATKGLPDNHRVGVLVDLPGNREPEFRAAIATITGGAPPSPAPNVATGQPSEKKSFVVQIVEPATL